MKSIKKKQTKGIIALVIAISMIGIPFPAYATSYGGNLIVNGDGESGSFIGWTLEGDYPDSFVNDSYADALYTNSPDGSLKGFDYYPMNPGGATLHKSIDISDLTQVVDQGAVTYDAQGYIRRVMDQSEAKITVEQLNESGELVTGGEQEMNCDLPNATDEQLSDPNWFPDWQQKYLNGIAVLPEARTLKITVVATIADQKAGSDYIEFDDIRLSLNQIGVTMDVSGNGKVISAGDTTPSDTDDTDFGSVLASSGTITKTFTIQNSDTTGLDLIIDPTIDISGTDTSDFSVSAEPAETTLADGQSTTFDIQFDPSDLGTRTATITIGNNTEVGSYTFTVQGTGNPDALVIDTSDPVGGTVGTAYAGHTFTSTGGTYSKTYTVTSGTLPGGLTLASDGALSGTPTAYGDFTFTVTATDSASTPVTDSHSYSMTIDPAALVIDTTNPLDGTEGTAYAGHTFMATGGTGSKTYAVTSGALPDGLTLASHGALSGTPTAYGNFTFTVTATDSATPPVTDSHSYTILIGAPFSTDATLKASSTVKGVTVTSLGTPNATLGSATPGAVTITAEKAADTSNATTFVTLFDKNDTNATVKAVKYASGTTDFSGFDGATAYTNATIADGDFFIVRVTAEDGTTINYYRINVTVTAAPSTAKAITAFDFNGLTPNVTGAVDEGAKTIALTVPYGTDVTALVPSITHTGASVSPNTGVAQDFTNPVTYTVKAADNSEQQYTVTVTKAANIAKAITAFDFNGLTPAVTGTVDEGAKTIALTVPYGTDVTALVPSITHTGASVSPNTGVAQDFTTPVTYIVKAADNSEQQYTVTVTKAANIAKAITAFDFDGLTPAVTGTVNEASKTIALTVPYGTDVTALVPTIVHTGTSVSPNTGADQNFTNAVTYTVTAADSSEQQYTVTVTVAANTTKAITAFNFNGLTPAVTGTVNEGAKTIALTVPYGTDVTALVPTIVHTGTSVYPNTGVAQNFTTPLTYTVTFTDSSTQDYTATVSVGASSNSNLLALSLSSGTLSPAFASGTTSYTASVGNADSSITVTSTVADGNATVEVNGLAVTSGGATGGINLSVGNNIITVVVTAQDGTTSNTYTITVTRAASSGSSGGSSSTTTTQPSQGTSQNTVVVVNGKEQNAGKETQKTEDGKSTVIVAVDNKAIESKIDEAIKNNTTGTGNVIQVPVADTKSEVAKVELTGDIVKKLEENTFDVSVKRDNVEYVIPAAEFTISKVAENLGIQEKALADIKVEVKITKLDEKVVEKYNEVAKTNGAELVFPPVQFEITAKTTNIDGTTKEHSINKFSNYVERVMEIPSGVDSSKITTGIVFNSDGTYSHVPTEVYQKDGKWYAKLNSLTNSDYSVIWNPVTVKSVENHWSKDAVNDMASRLVIFNADDFEPDSAITRADFAEYIVRALGLYREGSAHENHFKDVSAKGERTLAILIANEYGIVSGYSDGTFRGDNQITREEAMAMYQRAMEITKLVGSDENRYQNYTDYSQVSDWATSNVKEVLSAHVFNGTTATKISPKASLTYAEAAQAVRNLLVESKLISE
ncbi:S-layer homology domain-containing protein [Bacteroides sp.]|uniref:S-layer homology domain-containing protein n=1 Tax=Bacteroides sp. TaxID=29523 RepID=UPI00261FB2E5|nr:S-layer homology domain-containing protein [Bacteroides sp.]MDD3040980.1 S-layer homology domain-containing protein [Bacteroides sp.]